MRQPRHFSSVQTLAMQTVPKGFDAANAPNNEDIEKQFAVKCMEHAETYWKLITSMNPSKLRLTRHDDDLTLTFLEAFPEFQDTSRIARLSEHDLKSPAMKTRWRDYMKQWEKVIEDYNFGSLLRADCQDEYTEANSMFVLRIQFLIFEILRNKRGLNDDVYREAQQAKARKQ